MTAAKPKTPAKKKGRKTPAANTTPITPDQMLAMAVEQGADIDKLEKLMALQERWEANQAKKAFVVAMNEFKSDPPKIIKDATVSYETDKGMTTYNHAKLSTICDVIGVALSSVGISFRWVTNQDGGVITVTCILTHGFGHSEETTLRSTPDSTGGKNSIQAVGSAVTYLQRYTLLAAVGLAAEDQDTDGVTPENNGAAPDSFYPQDKFDAAFPAWKEKIESGKNTATKTIEFLTQKKGIALSPSQISTIEQVGK